MAEEVRTSVVATDIDDNGNVVVWDHGSKKGDPPVPLTMHSSDAKQALSVDPERYALEPRGLGSEVDAEVKKIQDARAAAKKHSEEHAARHQLAIDRKAAALTVHARHVAEAAKPKPKPAPAPTPQPSQPLPPQTG
jgi:hypothetical protein